jgi:hypothetical protein
MKISTIATALVLAFAALAASASPIQVKITDGYVMCASQANLQTVVELAKDDDKQALAAFLADESNLCGEALPGEVFYVEDIDTDEGMVQLRAKGKTISVWTIKEAIEPVK